MCVVGVLSSSDFGGVVVEFTVQHGLKFCCINYIQYLSHDS